MGGASGADGGPDVALVSGGDSGTGGALASGGVAGGIGGTGGALATAGASGGTPATGGVLASGGVAGGVTGTGGILASGGVAGGITGTGGVLVSGGRVASAGISGTGGTVTSGGRITSGGTSGTGGVSGGSVASAGISGTGGKGGSGGTGGSTAYQVTFNLGIPVYRTVLRGLLVATTSQNEGVVVGAMGAGPAQSPDPGPTIQWYTSAGAKNNEKAFNQAATPVAMTLGPDDSIWLVGLLTRSANFGGSTLPQTDNGYYLVHLAADGSHLLSTTVTSSQVVWLDALVTDAQGNLYMGGELVNTDYSVGTVFVRKVSSSGATIFDRTFASTKDIGAVFGIDLTPAGDIAIAGQFKGTLNFSVAQLTSKTGSAGTPVANGFVAVLGKADGTAMMARAFGGTVEDLGNSVQVTRAGALRVGGYVTGNGEVGGTAVSASASNSPTPFVAELNATTGAASWVRVLGGDGVVFDATTDAAGRTFAVGRFEGPGTGPARTTGSSSFVAMVQPDSSLKVVMQTLTNWNGAMEVAIDGLGGLWVSGEYTGSVNFGLGTLVATGPLSVSDIATYLIYLKPI